MYISSKLVESTVESEKVFDGVLLNVNKDTALMPNGKESLREWIRHPGACAVVPVYENGDIMLLRQYRYPVHQLFFEVPAGKIDAGEGQEATAVRELREETGIVCEELHYIGHFYPCIGYSNEVIHIYAATGLSEVQSSADEDEFVEPFRVSFNEAMGWVHNGTINDGKTVICLMRTWHWWRSLKKTH
jgi:ADP-ribose pyrophosphatase